MDSPPLTSCKEGYCLEPISFYLSAWMLSASHPSSSNEPVGMQNSLHFPSENKTKAKEGNLFNSNEVRGSIFMFESIAV